MCQKRKRQYDYDFIVIGMGAAGATLLRTLSDAGFSVIGIEAGINCDDDPVIQDPMYAGMLEEEYTWKYFFNQETEPNPDVNGIAMNYTTGRMLGGGSSINGMQYVRGSSQFWDAWGNINGNLWNATAAQNGFKELESFIGTPGAFDPSNHGTNGKMQTRQAPQNESSMAVKFANALATATGSSVISDYNDPSTPIGTFTRWSLFQRFNGLRASSSIDMLADIIDSNGKSTDKSRKVRIYLNSTVNKVKFNCHKKAVGVKFIQNGKSKYLHAQKEIILCAGNRSNEILQRSGVGNASYLNSLGIRVVYNNPAVGVGSKNHLISTAVFSANPDDSPSNGGDPNSMYVGGAFLPNVGDSSNKRGFQWIGVDGGSGVLVVVFYNLNPESVGVDKIQDKDPLRISAVAENLFSEQVDLNRIVDVYQQQITALNNVFANNSMYAGYQLMEPSLDVINDTDALKEHIKNELEHAHHWTGTCIMAPENAGGVVDNLGQVYGIKGLRVADISVAPIQPDSNTAAPAFFVGYNIAKQIIAKYL